MKAKDGILRKFSILIKANSKSYNWSDEKDNWLDTVNPDSWDVNISFYSGFLVDDGSRVALQYMICGNLAVVKGLDITLNNLAGFHREILLNGLIWMGDLLGR